jgi:predicted porin
MRKLLIVLTALMAAGTAHAADLGNGLSLNTEAKAFHKVDAETNHITVEPELRWTSGGPLSLWVESPITVYETNHASGDNIAILNVLDDGNYPMLELGADYALSDSSKAYVETTYDFNGVDDRGEITVGVSFNF